MSSVVFFCVLLVSFYLDILIKKVQTFEKYDQVENALNAKFNAFFIKNTGQKQDGEDKNNLEIKLLPCYSKNYQCQPIKTIHFHTCLLAVILPVAMYRNVRTYVL